MIVMKRVVLVLSILAVAACGGAQSPGGGGKKVLVDVDAKGVGLQGHDPVAYGADQKPVKGAAEHTSAHGGATYHFASPANKQAFDADPAKHAPRYGGYCAFAASQGNLSQADPTSFEVHEGALLMFTNADFKAQFAADRAGNKAKADQNWPGLVEKHGK